MKKKKVRLFTVSATENQNHNSSFITAETSSHNTGISIIQFPTSDSDGNCQTGEASSVSCSLPHSYTTVPAVSLLILSVETMGRINHILCPHFMDVTVHLCSLERQRNQHGKPGIPSLKSMMFILHNINNPYDAVDLKSSLFCLLENI